MSDELQQLAGTVRHLSQGQQKAQRRIENLEQAFLTVKDILLRQDETNDDWRAWRLEAEEHRRNTDAHISVLGELLVENAHRTAENSQAIAANAAAIAELRATVNTLAATVAKLAERNGHGAE